MTLAAFCVLATIASVVRWKTTIFFGIYKGTFIVNMIGSFCIGLINNLDNDAIIIIGILLYYIVNTLCQCNVERFIISGGKGGGGTASKPEDEGTRCTDSLWENYPDVYAMYFSEEEFKKIIEQVTEEVAEKTSKGYGYIQGIRNKYVGQRKPGVKRTVQGAYLNKLITELTGDTLDFDNPKLEKALKGPLQKAAEALKNKPAEVS